MFILTVAPVSRGILHGNLTYFAKERVPVGSVIKVPVRTREIPAIVLEITEASDSKSAVKSSEYAIRKITRIKPRRIWNKAFLNAVDHTARISAQGFGESLLTLTPKIILDAHLEGTLEEPEVLRRSGSIVRPRILAIQGDTHTRLESYRRLVRESFAQKKSVFICLPNELDVENISNELKSGIEDYTYTLSSSMTKKKILERWQNIEREKHPLLVVGTTQYLSLPKIFETIIIDEEQARTWKTLMRPIIDLRIFVESYARESGSSLIFGAPILRPEIHKRINEKEIGEFGRIFSHAHLENTAKLHTEIIDPRTEEKAIKEYSGNRTFQILSEKIRTLIQTAGEHKQSVLLLTARKGLSPITRCGDCGTVICCSHCDTPLVIHTRKDSTRIFSCHACGFVRIPENDVHETCPICGGWKLEAMGIGTERVEHELAEQFPTRSFFVFDGDRINTSAQAKKMIAQFKKRSIEGEAPLLIGTPMVIPYLDTVDNTAVISIDSLFAIPDFRMNERIFSMILSLREKTKNTLYVQTRLDDRATLEHATTGKLMEFVTQELALRKAFSYPPYGTIIKITLRGKKEIIPQEMDRAKQFLNDYTLLIPPTMSRDKKGFYRMHALIKLPEGIWGTQTTEALTQKLRTLPHQFTIEVNPEHLL